MPIHALAALQELIQALDRRRPDIARHNEAAIAADAHLLRDQALAQIEELLLARLLLDCLEQELADAVMNDDGAPIAQSN